MPVFFYIDPEFGEDPKMENIESITLSYTFFEAKESANLMKPSYAKWIVFAVCMINFQVNFLYISFSI